MEFGGGLQSLLLPSPQPGVESLSFVLRAPVHEATFFSLTLVEELLRHARRVDEEYGLKNLPLPHSRESTRVLSRILLENWYEEYWPTEHWGPDNRRRGAPSALCLLRIGLLRALGFHTSGLDELTDDASIVLGRDIVAAASPAGGFRPEPFYHREAAQEELRHMALGEWCEDLICFAAYRGFSAEQVRCVLLTAMHLMDVVAELPQDATDVDAEERCGHVLKRLLIEQACGLPNKVLETRNVERTVTYEEPDPQFLAALEEKIASAKNKKQQRALRGQVANAPLVSQTRVEIHQEKLLTEIVVGPYFTLQEVAHILDYLSSSVIQHWRLFRTFLSEPQPVETTYGEQVHWDTLSFCVPPLSEFLRDDVYAMEKERHAVVEACEAAINMAFDEEFMRPLCELQRERDELLEQQREQERQAEEDNLQNALDGPGYARVSRAFALRLGKCIERNEALSKKLCDNASSRRSSMTGTGSPHSASPHSKSLRRRSTVLRRSVSGTKKSRASDAFFASIPEPAVLSPVDTVFALEAVEARVARLETAAQTATDSQRSKKKSS